MIITANANYLNGLSKEILRVTGSLDAARKSLWGDRLFLYVCATHAGVQFPKGSKVVRASGQVDLATPFLNFHSPGEAIINRTSLRPLRSKNPRAIISVTITRKK